MHGREYCEHYRTCSSRYNSGIYDKKGRRVVMKKDYTNNFNGNRKEHH